MSTASSLLTIELKNMVAYQGDISDPTKFATDPNETTPLPLTNFFVATLIADIKAVNGDTTVKGTYFGRTRVVNSTPSPNPGQAIADVTRIAMREHFFEILNSQLAQIGTIMSTGFSGGVAPPGTGLPDGEGANWAIVGGTGAYLGARGQVGGPGGGPRFASMIEDPSKRWDYPGGDATFNLHVIPADPPRIMTSAFGPLVLHHTNHMPVTALTPAHAGENLLVFASGLGPTNPDVPLNLPFPVTPPSLVNSPLSVRVGGEHAEVLHAAGVPGTVNAYHVLFKVPPGVTPPVASLQLTVAWISGPPVTILVA